MCERCVKRAEVAKAQEKVETLVAYLNAEIVRQRMMLSLGRFIESGAISTTMQQIAVEIAATQIAVQLRMDEFTQMMEAALKDDAHGSTDAMFGKAMVN